jgi:predicted solute-binding protein
LYPRAKAIAPIEFRRAYHADRAAHNAIELKCAAASATMCIEVNPMSWNDSSALRLGALLEPCAEPLLSGLKDVPGVELRRMPFPELAERFRAEEFDCALLPPLVSLEHPWCRMLPGIGVIADGPAQSELLYSHTPLIEVREIALTPGSEPLQELVTLMVLAQGGTSPAFRVLEGETPVDKAEALLVSRSLALGRTFSHAYCHDLGRVWQEMTGLPLVLRAWLCRFRAPYPHLRGCLALARQSGLEQVARIAQEFSVHSGLPLATAEGYFTRTLGYSLSSREADGLRRMRDLAIAHGLCAAEADFRFC